MDDLMKWRVKMLAAFGGFSIKAIANRVGATENQVGYYLQTQGIRLKDWRDMVTPQSQAHAKAVTKAKGGQLDKPKQRRRVA